MSVDGGRDIVTFLHACLILRSVQTRARLPSSDRMRAITPIGAPPAPLEPDYLEAAREALGGELVRLGAGADPGPRVEILLLGPGRLEHAVGDRQSLGEHPLDRLAVAAVGGRHVGQEADPEGDVTVLVTGDVLEALDEARKRPDLG